MGIINYEATETFVKNIEAMLEECDMEEKQLILKFVTNRLQSRVQQQRINDNMQKVKLGSLVKKFMKNPAGDDE